jgi:capsular exopolysaccharide synthesis family protein
MAATKEVIWNTSYENLYVMPLGSLAPNPTELLSSNRMEELLKELEVKYDYIIFDTPPVNVVSDSLSLVKLADGVVIVVREGITSHPNIFKAVEKFNFIEANILGFVLNGVSRNQGDRSKSHYYYY